MELETLIELKNSNHIKYDYLLSKIASYLFIETASNTSSNNWTTYFDEIEAHFELEDGFINKEIANDIENRLTELFKEIIAQVEIYYEEGGYDEEKGCYVECDRYFDITLYDSFIPAYTEIDLCIEENSQKE